MASAPPGGSALLAGTAGGLAIWKSLNISFPVFFSRSPSGSRAVKAPFSFGAAGSLAGGRGGGRVGPCWSTIAGNGPGWNGLVTPGWPHAGAPGGGGPQLRRGGDRGAALKWAGPGTALKWAGPGAPQTGGGTGRPPKADGWG
ncbi:hypothetical protein EYF80_063509 [Liparis tanakae]|uniref:Uncharacterized protein n=1 Tax=Liparis tanakae TaxID=230148 RepID=A0A4Z2ECX4_9TELE|nr:hypothetical protein EYF80_063509 [Liparis tanakae]